MTEITKYEKVLIVNSFSTNELEITHAASKIFSRVFTVSMVRVRLKDNFSETSIYNSLRKLEDKGIFFINKEDNKKLIVRFTEKGRSICNLVKDKIQTPNNCNLLQTPLFPTY